MVLGNPLESLTDFPQSSKPLEPVRASVTVVETKRPAHVRRFRQGLGPFVLSMKNQRVRMVPVEPTAHVRLPRAREVTSNIRAGSLQSPEHAADGQEDGVVRCLR